VFECCVDLGAVSSDLATEFHEGRDPAALRPCQPPVEGLLAGVALDLEHEPEPLLEQVPAVQTRIGLGDPGQLGLLMDGEVLRVLPQGVTRPFETLGTFGRRSRRGVASRATTLGFGLRAGISARLVPCLSAQLVERVGRPRDHMKRIGTPHGLGTVLDDRLRDPRRSISRCMGDLSTPFRPQQDEELVERCFVTTDRSPQQIPGVVIDHDCQILVTALVGDLIDPDPTQTCETIHLRIDLSLEAGNDSTHRAPPDPHQLTHR